MTVEQLTGGWEALEVDALILPVFEGENAEQALLKEIDQKVAGGILDRAIGCRNGKCDFGKSLAIYPPAGSRVKTLLVVSAGRLSDFDAGGFRQLLTQALRQLASSKITSLGVVCRAAGQIPFPLRCAVAGVKAGLFNPALHKHRADEVNSVDRVTLVVDPPLPPAEASRQIRMGSIAGDAINLARELTNEPGNILPPETFAERARKVASDSGLEVEVLGLKELDDLGMGGLLAVSQGSIQHPRLIVLKHVGAADKGKAPAVLIGKGVTFDSGGLSLKPGHAMEEMKGDKAGACTVLGAMQAVARLGIERNVVGLLPVVENLPSGSALRPGDVYRSYSGKTVEVLNTDAEGRLILADAIAYACRVFKPSAIIDLATLTGSCVVALGYERAGLFSNDDDLCGAVEAASKCVGEKLWRMPLDAEYRRELDSKIADIKNIGSKWGGAITAAKFLEEFVEEVPWCHIDMAGKDFHRSNGEDLGPTGFGVITLIEFLLQSSPENLPG